MATVPPQASELTPAAIISLLNSIRAAPKSFLEAVNTRLSTYVENKYRDTLRQKFKSTEGPKACKELHDLLETLAPLPPLVTDTTLASIAQSHCDTISAEGIVTHIGGTGMEVVRKLDEKGEWSGRYNECIGVQACTPTDLLLKWLIDDGIPSRGDRKALLIEKTSKIGIGVSLHHKTHQVCVVAILVENFGPKGSSDVPEPVQNENITNELPDDIKVLPDDALSMQIVRRTIIDNSTKKMTYTLKYEQKDGTFKEVVKSYVQQSDGRTIPLVETAPTQQGDEKPKAAVPEPKKEAAKDQNKVEAKDGAKKAEEDSKIIPPLPLLPGSGATIGGNPTLSAQPVPPSSTVPPPPGQQSLHPNPAAISPPVAPQSTTTPPPPGQNPQLGAPQTSTPPPPPANATPPPPANATPAPPANT